VSSSVNEKNADTAYRAVSDIKVGQRHRKDLGDIGGLARSIEGDFQSRPTLLAVDGVTVPPDRMRQLRPEVVAKMAESIRAQGLLQPIVVCRTPEGALTLVAGWHRLEATKLLGHTNIRASVLDINADEARLVEIDENLARADLSTAERSLHLAERKRLYEKLYPETKHGVAGALAKHGLQTTEMSFAETAASVRGKSIRTIQREIERAKKIPDLRSLIGTTLDSPDQLDALAKLPADKQSDLIERAKAGEDVQVRAVVVKERRIAVVMNIPMALRYIEPGAAHLAGQTLCRRPELVTSETNADVSMALRWSRNMRVLQVA
jgi:ParB family chromosome partitioning protein